jgi:hypothetical protein
MDADMVLRRLQPFRLEAESFTENAGFRYSLHTDSDVDFTWGFSIVCNVYKNLTLHPTPTYHWQCRMRSLWRFFTIHGAKAAFGYHRATVPNPPQNA